MIRDFTRSRRVVQEAAQRGVFPGAVAAAATSRGVLWLESFGLASLPEQRKMQVDSVFDLASLTKPVATAAALLRLVDAWWMRGASPWMSRWGASCLLGAAPAAAR